MRVFECRCRMTLIKELYGLSTDKGPDRKPPVVERMAVRQSNLRSRGNLFSVLPDLASAAARSHHLEEIALGQIFSVSASDPLTIVLFFDLWHLDLFRRTICGPTQVRAFDQARQMVKRSLRPGDRLLLVTFAGWPRIHGGWIRDPENDEMESVSFLKTSTSNKKHNKQ